MNSTNERMKWILFWSFLIPFLLAVFGTLASVFLGFGSPTQNERELLVTAFLVELAACIIALFYSIFGLKRSANDSEQIENSKLESKVEELDSKILLLVERLNEYSNPSQLSEVNIPERTSERPNFIQELFPHLDIIAKVTTPPPFDIEEYTIHPTWGEIGEDIDSAKPYERTSKRENYVGLKVQWICTYENYYSSNNQQILNLNGDRTMHSITAVLKEGLDITRLKTMDKLSPMWVAGQIKDIEGIGLTLEQVEFKPIQIE
ncbi:hypothetical protein SAMN05216361_1504 [Marisediminitalea aggregata]|uniref:Uncharacterized protein n=1 Tax=Marisediminitalea aggregata TaxID=634436 RepID=A0A1M5HJY5_9ALTE|nr:hypothetical protein [Marisediminitalea aggregata]SHG16283.1 hypothetical protein SAMN05216361_1504 [Marisediminitalea aggregata]